MVLTMHWVKEVEAQMSKRVEGISCIYRTVSWSDMVYKKGDADSVIECLP